MADEVDETPDSTQAKSDALALAEQAEAEAAEAEALAAAARARARAIKLRREAQIATEAEHETKNQPKTETEPESEPEPETAPDSDTEPATGTPADEDSAPGRSRVRLALGVAAVVAIVGLLGASGWMVWQHHKVVDERQQAAAYIATARQGVVNLTTLDFKKSKEDVQRILDSATGDFRDQFQKTAEDFASVVKDTKAVAEGTVAVAAVESMNNDSAVVLVLANERVTNAAGAKDEPRTFRFKVSVVHEGGQLKLSRVEFVL